MSDFAAYLSKLSSGLKILSNDIDGIISDKKEKSKKAPFKSMMSPSRFISNSEKLKGVDYDCDKILKAVSKLFGG